MDTLAHAGPPRDGAATAAAGSVRRGSAVQFSAQRRAGAIADVRFSAFGGPELIAVCEYVSRAAEGAACDAAPAPDAAGWVSALGLPRAALGDALVAEDAYRALLARLSERDD